MITSFFAPKSKRADEDEESVQENKRQRVSNPTANLKTSLSPEVQELVSHLHDSPDASPSWAHALHRHMSSQSFSSLAKFIASERKTHTIYPPAEDAFSALNLTPLKDVKVVIVGQDPYHGPLQAHGLSFSVRKGVQVPASLKNIYKELTNDTDVDFPTTMPTHGYLERWAKQGVLMINSVLTVRKGIANSHRKRGWESFTDEVIRILHRETKHGLVFLLWGKPASEKAQNILYCGGQSKHKVICSSHPSPLGATKTNSPFLGSKCFSRANEALLELGLKPIDWNVDGDL